MTDVGATTPKSTVFRDADDDFFMTPEEFDGVFKKSPLPTPVTPCRFTRVDVPAKPQPETPRDEPKLSAEQQELVDLILSGRNVFYTGSAGTGKSTVLKAAVRALRQQGLRVDIVAPTGRSALQINGKSTWSYMGWTPDHDKFSMKKIISATFRRSVRRRIQCTDVLVIDEISMIENNHFERMSQCMAHARKSHPGDLPQPFGGVQLIVTGDFCQLPPVKPFAHCIQCGLDTILNDDETEFRCPSGDHGPFLERDKWAFKSPTWDECDMVHVQLNQVHRQSDVAFIRMLQKCRLGVRLRPDETNVLFHHPCNVDKATHLYPTRHEANSVNFDRFSRMKTPIYTYKAVDDFDWRKEAHPYLSFYQDRLPDGSLLSLSESRLQSQVDLRAGMLVVLQTNLDLPSGLCNGSQGIICGWEHRTLDKLPQPPVKEPSIEKKKSEGPTLSQVLEVAKQRGEDWATDDDDSYTIMSSYANLKAKQVQKFALSQDHARHHRHQRYPPHRDENQREVHLPFWPRVLFHNGIKRTIFAECIVNALGDDEPYSLLHRTQVPLMPAWAMSIHKSQGMTLDRVIVDLSRAFEQGQVYVALSRATSLDGLRLEGDPKGLGVGEGGNADVQEFLSSKFGDDLFKSISDVPAKSDVYIKSEYP